MRINISAAKFLSLAALLSFFSGQAHTQTYGLHFQDGRTMAMINYEDSSFLSIHYTNMSLQNGSLRFAWSRFSEQGDSVVFHSNPFAGLPEYSLMESRTFSVNGYAEHNAFCKIRNDTNEHQLGRPVFDPEDTASSLYLRLSTSSFSPEGCMPPRANRSDSLDLLFEDGHSLTIPCDSKGLRFCYTCRFDYSQNPPNRRKPKAIRFKIKGISLPWYELKADEHSFIELVYLKIERQGLLLTKYGINVEHFYDMNNKIAERLNDSTWVFDGVELYLRPLNDEAIVFDYGERTCFKYRPDDPAFDFRVLDYLPKAANTTMHQYSPHLDKPKPEKPPTQHKRRE